MYPDPGAQPPVPPGWYPDPSGAPVQRYFDGVSWTPQTAPAHPAVVRHPAKRPPWIPWIVAGVALVAVLIFLLIAWINRPSRMGQPGQPGQTARPIAMASLVTAPDAAPMSASPQDATGLSANP